MFRTRKRTKDQEYREWLYRMRWVGHILPPWGRIQPPLPPGLANLSAAWKLGLARAGEWGIALGLKDIHLRRRVASLVSEAAASGSICPPLLDAQGRLWSVSEEFWRSTLLFRGRHEHPAAVACGGGLVPLALSDGGGTIMCHVLISLHDLAFAL